jgi:hypothetical protein
MKERIMDYAEAIKAHSDWKMKLKVYLAKPDHSLKVAEVGRTIGAHWASG